MDIINLVKGLGPVIIGVIALIFADRHISKQARLSAKVQWIENFRNNTIKLLTKHSNFLRSYNYKEQTYSEEAYSDLLEQISFLRILLKKVIRNKA
ncbi:MAG TPA: hypothetical protein VIL78_13650 [Hanamia sp.]